MDFWICRGKRDDCCCRQRRFCRNDGRQHPRVALCSTRATVAAGGRFAEDLVWECGEVDENIALFLRIHFTEIHMRTILVFAINTYRRYVSPRKGFCCAYAVRHNCGSCSDFALRAVKRVNMPTFCALLYRRFTACRDAHVFLELAAPDGLTIASTPPTEEPDRKEFYARYCAADAAATTACCFWGP